MKETTGSIICNLVLSAMVLLIAGWPPVHYALLEEAQTGIIAWKMINFQYIDPQFMFTNLVATTSLWFGGNTLLDLRIPFVVLSISGVCILFYTLIEYTKDVVSALYVTLLYITAPYFMLSLGVADEYIAPMFLVIVGMAGIVYNNYTLLLIAGTFLFFEHDAYKPFSALYFGTFFYRWYRNRDIAAWHVLLLGVFALLVLRFHGEFLYDGVFRHVTTDSWPTMGHVLPNLKKITTLLFQGTQGRFAFDQLYSTGPIFGTVLVAYGMFGFLTGKNTALKIFAICLFIGLVVLPFNVVSGWMNVLLIPLTFLCADSIMLLRQGGPPSRFLRWSVPVIVLGSVFANGYVVYGEIRNAKRWAEIETPPAQILAAVLEAPKDRKIMILDHLDFDLFKTKSDIWWMTKDLNGVRFPQANQAIAAATLAKETGEKVYWVIQDYEPVLDYFGSNFCTLYERKAHADHTKIHVCTQN